MDDFYSEADHYTYAGTSVLINRLDLREQGKLDQAERLLVSARLMDRRCLPRTFDFTHFRALHFYMFQDLYDWAGIERDVLIGKGGSLFAAPLHIRSQATRLLAELRQELINNRHSVAALTRVLSHFVNEMNVVHAFREGNGRHLRAFVRQVLEGLGCGVNVDAFRRESWISAVIAGFHGDEGPMAALFEDIIVTPATNREHLFEPIAESERRRFCTSLRRLGLPPEIVREYRQTLHC